MRRGLDADRGVGTRNTGSRALQPRTWRGVAMRPAWRTPPHNRRIEADAASRSRRFAIVLGFAMRTFGTVFCVARDLWTILATP